MLYTAENHVCGMATKGKWKILECIVTDLWEKGVEGLNL